MIIETTVIASEAPYVIANSEAFYVIARSEATKQPNLTPHAGGGGNIEDIFKIIREIYCEKNKSFFISFINGSSIQLYCLF